MAGRGRNCSSVRSGERLSGTAIRPLLSGEISSAPSWADQSESPRSVPMVQHASTRRRIRGIASDDRVPRLLLARSLPVAGPATRRPSAAQAVAYADELSPREVDILGWEREVNGGQAEIVPALLAESRCEGRNPYLPPAA